MMLTPKKKAKEIFNKYNDAKDDGGWYISEFESCAKVASLICVDEIIKVTHEDPYNRKNNRSIFDKQYWQEVKKHLEQL